MTSHEIFWYRVYAVTAVILLVLSCMSGFGPLAFAAGKYCFATVMTVLAGLFISIGIKEPAKRYFDTNYRCWFLCLSGFLFVSFNLILLSSMFFILSGIISDPVEREALHPTQMVFVLPASTILWMLMIASPLALKYCLPPLRYRHIHAVVSFVFTVIGYVLKKASMGCAVYRERKAGVSNEKNRPITHESSKNGGRQR
jgi:hypothetical protein